MRAATEFDPLSSMLIRWPFDWPALVDEYVQLVQAFVTAGVRVQIRVDSSRQRTAAEQVLRDAGIPLDVLDWRIENTDTVWIRDYGPQFLVPLAGGRPAVVDFHYYRDRPNDDDTPREVAGGSGLAVVDRESTDVVYTEGEPAATVWAPSSTRSARRPEPCIRGSSTSGSPVPSKRRRIVLRDMAPTRRAT
jgi:hypothetical protein